MSTSIQDLDSLIRTVREGTRPKYLFFWGHQPSKDGTITSTCLSQWFAAPFAIDGITYPTAEHYMMAEKARLFGDDEVLDRIIRAPHPGAAKKLGRQVQGFEESIWNAHRFDIVVRGNRAKFTQHDNLRTYLLGTRDRVLVEASPVDRIWGIGLARDDARAEDPEQWRGLNLLGFALMQVRREIRDSPTGSASKN